MVIIEFSDNFPSFLRKVPEISSSFEIVERIGRGTFGVVFMGISRINSLQYALKFLIPTSSSDSVLAEVKALQLVGKHLNVVELLAYVRHLDQIVLVFPYFPHHSFKHLLSSFTVKLAKIYMRHLLSALSHIYIHLE